MNAAVRGGRGRVGWRDLVIDVAPSVGLWAAGLLDIAFGLADAVGDAPPLSSFVPMTAICAVLALRRRYPLAVLCAIVLIIAVPVWVAPISLGYWGEFVPWLVALYSCGRHEQRLALRGAGAAVSGVALAVIAARFPEMADPGDLLYDAALLAGAWCLGVFARSWAHYRDDALRQEIGRAQTEERAATAERARIARELHDVISHTITVIVMQAGGARMAAARTPDAAIEALGRIEGLGQDSLRELRTMLAVLRDTDDVGAHVEGAAPQPMIADIPGLCERMHELGLPVSVSIQEDLAGLSAGVQLCCYRVVQECLTNALKHAGSAVTDVSVTQVGASLHVEVASAAGAATSALSGGGHGLIGLRERVYALGGTLEAGTRPDGRFVVLAMLPAGEASS